jgi:proteasome-associated ATPase
MSGVGRTKPAVERYNRLRGNEDLFRERLRLRTALPREREGETVSKSRDPAKGQNPFSRAVSKLSGHSGGAGISGPRRVIEYEREISALRSKIRYMEEEIVRLRGRLSATPQEFEFLDNKLKQSSQRLSRIQSQNEKLVNALNQARERIEILREEVEKLTAPPASYGILYGFNEDGTVNILTAGRKMKVNLHPDIDVTKLRKGQELVLNDAMNAIEVKGFEVRGEVVSLKALLDDSRAIVTLRADEEVVAEIAEPLRKEKLRPGDIILYDPKSGYLLEKLPRSEMTDVMLEVTPDVTYGRIGGLDRQIEQLRDAIEIPFVYGDYYREHHLKPPKGVLLYGPPGCGKTLIAKAVANALASHVESVSGREAKSYFFNIKGPELLDKYVGESERKIREVFRRAREQAREGMPVIIFFDEFESLFRTRGSGISSDVESTIVPQFLSEIDGVEDLRNVIIIGASNRQDLIDPAVLRPGRLDIKIRIDRPDAVAAREIFAKYLTPDLPFDKEELSRAGGEPERLVESLIERTVERMYRQDEENRFLEVTYASGEKEILYFKDFVSGAMIESVVSRAKRFAIKRLIDEDRKGIREEDLLRAVCEEYQESEDLPNTTNPDDWVKISGRKSEKIINVQSLTSRREQKERKIDTITPGQYL